MPTEGEMNAAVSGAIQALQQLQKEGAKTSAVMKEAAGKSGGFGQVNESLLSIAKNLAGPVGVAAGFYAAGKALAEFSDQRLALSEFAKDVHLSADSVYGLRRAMFLAGKEGAEADRAIASFSSTIQDLNAKKFAAPVFQDLIQKGPDMQKVVKDLMAFGDDVDGALRYVESHWKDWGTRFRHEFLEAFHMSESDMQATFGRLSGQMDEHIQKMAEDNAKRWRGYRQMFSDAGEYAFGGLLDLMDRLSPTALEARRQQIEKLLTPKAVDPLAKYSIGEDPMGADYQRPESLVGKVHGWLGNRSDAGTHPDITDFSGRRRTDDLIDVQTDSSKTLHDIRDSLQRMETDAGDVRSSNVGGGRHGLARRLGIDTATPGGGGGGLRDVVGGGGALSGNADVADVANLAGNEALEKQRASRIAELNNDPELKENVLKMLALEESKGVPRTAAMEALLNRSVMTKNSIKQELFSGFYGPINRGGLNRELGEGSRATSQAAMDAAGRGSNLIQGRTDQGAPGDPNARGPGLIKVPGTGGIYNYWQGKRGGHFYSHEESAAFAEQQNRLADRLVPTLGERKQTRYDFRRGGDARPGTDSGTQFGGGDEDDVHARDMTDTQFGGGDASMSATVDFKNMPSWVRTSIDDNGKFKNLKVSRSTPQGGLSEQNPWAYDR